MNERAATALRLARRLAGWLGAAATRVACAVIVIGMIEVWRLWALAPSAALLVIGVGLTAVGGFAIGMPLLAVASAAGAVPVLRRWRERAAAPGPTRIVAIVEAVVTMLAVAGFWVIAQRTSSVALGRFKASGATGVLVATVLGACVVALAGVAAVIAPLLSRVLEPRRRLHAWTAGWRGAAVALVVGIAALAGGARGLHRLAPGFDYRPAFMGFGFVLALAIATTLGVERRLRRAGAAAVVVVALVAAAASLVVIGRADVARTAVAGRGTTTTAVLRILWKLSDDDGDGYAGRFGGADCNDGDATVSPGASEIVANGRDDNCAGGDVTADDLAPRLETVPPRDPQVPRRNVLLITIDTVRADHVGAYGYQRPTTPELDAVAARGALFEHAVSPSPITRRAMPALMTGRYASTLAFADKSWPPRLIAGRHRLLAQSFEQAGYRTRAVLCCDDIFGKGGVLTGFGDVDLTAAAIDDKPGDVVAARTVNALTELAATPGPFFVWVHFFDPHSTYKPHPGTPVFGGSGRDRYDGEIAFVDAQLGVILDALAAGGLADDTIIAISSDHGEGFNEHGVSNHGNSLYDELLRVPLVIAVPDAPPQRIAGPVSTIDLGATLLDLVGLPRPAGQNGRSLADSVLTGAAPPDRVILAELIADRQIARNLRAAYRGSWKLIWDLDASTYELYSLTDDPGERDNQYGQRPDVAVELVRAMAATTDLELTLLPTDRHSAPPRVKPAPKKKKQ